VNFIVRPHIVAWRRPHRKHSFPYIVACWEVFTEPLPVSALIKSVTISFQCVSLGSSTVQLHDSLVSRPTCACSEPGFSSQNATVLEDCTTEEQCSVVLFGGQKDSVQRIYIKKCFLFAVGSVCRLKRFTPGSRNVVNVSVMKIWKQRCGSG
jgi:hypothetical protein